MLKTMNERSMFPPWRIRLRRLIAEIEISADYQRRQELRKMLARQEEEQEILERIKRDTVNG